MAKRYSDEDIERGLTALAVLGSPTEAAEASGVPAKTLTSWRKTQAARLNRIQLEHAPKIRERIQADLYAMVQAKNAKVWAMLERLDPEMIRHGELAQSIKNLDQGKAIDLDRANNLAGMPSVIVQKLDANELLDKLDRIAPGAVIDGTAEEIGPGE